MPFSAIYQDQYAVDQFALDEDLNYLAHLVCGYIIHYLGTPASVPTWNLEMDHHVQRFLAAVANTNPKIRPSAVFRTILVIARYKTNHPGVVAFSIEGEMLFYIAFAKVAALFDPSFNIETAIALLVRDRRWQDKEFLFRLLRCHVDRELKEEMAPSQMDLTAAKVLAMMEFYLAPFVDEGLRRGLGGGMEMQCPTMPSTTPLKPKVPSRTEQKMLFPLVPYKMREHLVLKSIPEEHEQWKELELEQATNDYYKSLSMASYIRISPVLSWPFRSVVDSISFATTSNSFTAASGTIESSSSSRPSLSTMTSRSSGSSADLKPLPPSSTADSSSMSLDASLSSDTSSSSSNVDWFAGSTSAFDMYPLRTPVDSDDFVHAQHSPRRGKPKTFIRYLGSDSEEWLAPSFGNGDSSFVGGVLHMVAAKLRLSRTSGRPSRIRKALSRLGLPVGAPSRRW